MQLNISVYAVLVACVVVAVVGVSRESETSSIEKRSTINTVGSSLNTAASIAGGVATVLKLTSVAFPLAGIFTGLFSFILGFLQNDRALWEKMEKRMKEIAKEEVANYHDLQAQGFISGIKRTADLFNKLPTTSNQKITEGVVLSGIINNNRQWVNVELGKNPHTMILYYMEVASIDVAVLYNLAALYGKRDRAHWIRLETRIGHHITDAESAAKKVINWRISSKNIQCVDSNCGAHIRDYVKCKKATDNLREVCRTKKLAHRCGIKQCYTYKRQCDLYTKSKVGASNCDFFKNEIRSNTVRWLNTNVYDAVKMWKDLVKRA